MNLRKKLLTVMLVLIMSVPVTAQVVLADTNTFTVIFKTNADVEMGREEYTVGDETNALPETSQLSTKFSDFIAKAKQKGSVYVRKEGLWYEDKDFTIPAEMPEGEAGKEYVVYCGLAVGSIGVSSVQNGAENKSYSEVKNTIQPYLGVGSYYVNGRNDGYAATIACFEKKTDDGWREVDENYYTDHYGTEWPNMIYFSSVADSGQYRIKYLRYKATDNDGNVLYYDYGYDSAGAEYTVNITPVELTITGVSAVDRDYDGTGKVELTGGELEGVLFDDEVEFELGEGTVGDLREGEGLPVATDIKLIGAKSVNYVLKQPEGITVNITPAPKETDSGKGTGGSSYSLEEKKNKRDDKADENNEEEEEDNSDITAESNGGNNTSLLQNFEDVKLSDWFYSDVTKANAMGIMNGISDTKFNPNDYLTRGMAAVIIHNAEGSPVYEGVAPFLDVTSDKYYSEAVAWAAEKRILNGYSEEIFAPEELITREQMAVALYNYAQLKGREINSFANLDIYSDMEDISYYAREAVSWAVGNGYLIGRENGVFDPKGSATRAEMASIIIRYLNI